MLYEEVLLLHLLVILTTEEVPGELCRFIQELYLLCGKCDKAEIFAPVQVLVPWEVAICNLHLLKAWGKVCPWGPLI